MKKKVKPVVMNLSRFKNGFSLIPIYNIAKLGDKYGLTSGNLFFRSYSDLVAEQVWKDNKELLRVLEIWHYCFPEAYVIDSN